MTQDDLKTVSFDKTGRVRFWINGDTTTLSPPSLGQFKKVKAALITAQGEIKELRAILEDKTLDQSDVLKRGTEISDRHDELNVKVLRLIFNELGDKPLPDDADEWPAWLVTDQSLLPDMMTHWRTVPLGRG